MIDAASFKEYNANYANIDADPDDPEFYARRLEYVSLHYSAPVVHVLFMSLSTILMLQNDVVRQDASGRRTI